MDLLKLEPNVVTSGVSNKHFLFYGEPSTRKTSVAAMFPDPLFLASEIGYKQIPNVVALDIDSWATFKTAVNELKKPEVKERYKTIVLDTVGILSDLCVQYICNLNSVKALDELPFGKGWQKYKTEFSRTINKIAQLGYSIVFIAHSSIKRNNEGEIINIEPLIDKRPKETIVALTDFVFYLQKEKKEDGTETVFAYSQLPNENIVTKTRIRNFAPVFEFTYDNLVKELNKALGNYKDIYTNAAVSDEVKPVVEQADLVPFEKIREEVVELASKLLNDQTTESRASEIIQSAMNGVPISKAPESYRGVLIALEAELNTLIK